jgi:hypothetical protein
MKVNLKVQQKIFLFHIYQLKLLFHIYVIIKYWKIIQLYLEKKIKKRNYYQ